MPLPPLPMSDLSDARPDVSAPDAAAEAPPAEATTTEAPASNAPAVDPDSPEALFDSGVARYRAGEGPATLVPLFKDVCDRSPKSSSAWTCLAWLYLLDGKGSLALKAAKKGVKLNPQDAQARINLALAMLETQQKGVREHVELAEQIAIASDEVRAELKENLEEALRRAPNRKSFQRVWKWLFDS